MAWLWHVPVYLVDLALMVYLSFVLGDLVDLLDKKTKISGAFIGGVLLAAVTSLPELFTAISSIFFVNQPEYVVGDLLGSIIFDLVVLSVETLIFVKSFRNAKLDKFHLFNGIACLLMYGFAAYAFFAPENAQVMLGDINLMSILIFVLYILTLVFQPKEKEEEKEEEDALDVTKEDILPEQEKGMNSWSVRKIWVMFALCSVLLIGSSIALTYLTSFLQADFPVLTGSVAGALLLGIGTSIPELISSFQLFKKKNFDAGFGNIIGSCTFDFAIFALADFLTWHQWNTPTQANKYADVTLRGIYISSPDAVQFEIFGLVVAGLTILFLLLKVFTKIFEKKKGLAYTITGIWAAACVAMYLIIYII